MGPLEWLSEDQLALLLASLDSVIALERVVSVSYPWNDRYVDLLMVAACTHWGFVVLPLQCHPGLCDAAAAHLGVHSHSLVQQHTVMGGCCRSSAGEKPPETHVLLVLYQQMAYPPIEDSYWRTRVEILPAGSLRSIIATSFSSVAIPISLPWADVHSSS